MKRILVVSHCILNTASKVAQDETELAEEYAQKEVLMKTVLEKNIQLLQLPCPEFLLYGSRRWGHVKDQFVHPHFKQECRKMLEPILMQLEEYTSYPEDFQVLGIVSVEGSPSCGHGLTCRGSWYGEIGAIGEINEVLSSLSMEEEPGAMMEILETELKIRGLTIPVMNIKQASSLLESL